jgi:hypothetical protein
MIDISKLSYADDQQLYDSCLPRPSDLNELADRINNTFRNIYQWMTFNGLKLNSSKTELILVGTKVSVRKAKDHFIGIFKLMDEHLPLQQTVKSLGFNLDEFFSCSEHVKVLTKKAYFMIHRINRVSEFLDFDTKRLLLQTMVNSILDYCGVVMFGITSDRINAIQKVQNCAVRTLYNLRKRTPVTTYLVKAHWLRIKQRQQFRLMSLVHDCVYGEAPAYLKNCINRTVSNRTTRQSLDNTILLESRTKLHQTECIFEVSGPRLWNR